MQPDRLKDLIHGKLKVYGLLSIREVSRGGQSIYLVRMMSLPFIAQNDVTVTINRKGFTVSSGVIFDAKDSPKDVVSRVEVIVNDTAERSGLEAWKAADSFMVRKSGEDLAELGGALVKVAEALRTLNRLLSEEEPVREECLRKKAGQMLYFE